MRGGDRKDVRREGVRRRGDLCACRQAGPTSYTRNRTPTPEIEILHPKYARNPTPKIRPKTRPKPYTRNTPEIRPNPYTRNTPETLHLKYARTPTLEIRPNPNNRNTPEPLHPNPDPLTRNTKISSPEQGMRYARSPSPETLDPTPKNPNF